MSSVVSLWDSLREQLKTKVTPLNYNNWFRPVSEARLDGEQFVINVPNKFIADWISDNYLDLLEKEASQLVSRSVRIRFEISQVGSVAPSVSEIRPSIQAGVKQQVSSPLNLKYSFDSFVVGSGNQLAHAAAKAVAELPGGHYNPLFLYGGVGLGKTHLLNAVGLEVSKRHPEMKIIYLSAEKFMNEFIDSVRNNKMEGFRKKYRTTCDMLLIDDIQFLGGKESTQEEFFHTFNELYHSQRQIVVTSDKIPKEIPGIEDRLRTRFEWGLIADIQAPDLETRIAILKKKAETDGIILNNEVAMYLASQIKSNVRELEGVLIRLHAFASLKNSQITPDLAKEVLKNILPSKNGASGSVESIQQAVAEYYQVKVSDLKSPRRMKGFSHPRQIAMYLCKKHLKVSFPELGHKFGGKDHTTVIHACRKIEGLLEQDSNLQNDIAILERAILH
ncbi:MAG: chromosomal replication initiation protein DnaA [Deltaproteobacteria bacterium RIFCSPLOWO2_01_44_7]|nr:MAG: chromosomal replication initiation protein DnaA [Deltaproteobacteria bacterium RIFCSPHIGHO2_01_FULL_43_49]OGQ15322.1 MAG: chromosomal replication initiation protein DnaA [Deltaproteobacteria bacterium RIFCSPHIGHO2_02_FULL_44_53]OGQ27373.1 MAG: chromosomal replication initiation protein DnaA [Deltaproteobacteria bacterium RIFCSPHIGHO2_12_FULL_44_21]OGQ31838.1 MAG: chromosomal replication initiation protein DnaA [Deltaproteobacteria bacterium RIFCSPLOWO2_01_FULL_45_74]OGQ38556.1 MAG: chro